MNSHELYDYQDSFFFGGDYSCQSVICKEIVQNCSVLEIDIDHLDQEYKQQNFLQPCFTLQELINFKQQSNKIQIPIPSSIHQSQGKQYLNLKAWEQRRKKQSFKTSRQNTSKSERKRLLNQMMFKLNNNQKALKQLQVDDKMVKKIQNIMELLGEVQNQIKNKQNFSLGMKLKMKVDPKHKYFINKLNQQNRISNTSRQKIQKAKFEPKQKIPKVIKQKSQKREVKTQQKSSSIYGRKYTTETLYSISLSQKNKKGHHLRSVQNQSNSLQKLTDKIRLKRQQIVDKQIKRRQKLFNRLSHKKQY